MKTLLILLTLVFACALSAHSQPNANFDTLKFRGFKIGDKVDTTLYAKYGDVYFPNYLDQRTLQLNELPEQYKGLPIAIWQLKKDSSIALTLLNDIILKITVSYIQVEEKDRIEKMLTEKFGFDGVNKSYQEKHPFQSYITFWDLKTWETKDIIVQIGYGDLRLPEESRSTKLIWNLVYTNLLLEKKIINDFKAKRKDN
jgi:hypothetical protein